jgi:hypothetical protein
MRPGYGGAASVLERGDVGVEGRSVDAEQPGDGGYGFFVLYPFGLLRRVVLRVEHRADASLRR